MVRVEAVLDSWKSIRRDAAQAVEEFPESEFNFRPVPELMSFRETARHILESGHALTGLLLEGVEDFAVPEFRQMLMRHPFPLPDSPDAGALASGLRESVEGRCGALVAQTPEFFGKIITRFDGARVTRLEMVQFVKEHELTHRAQLFMILRLKGIAPPTTRRRQARK